MIPVIAISMGDYNGIGPEVILKTLSDKDLNKSTPLIIGHSGVFEYYSKQLGLSVDFHEVNEKTDIQLEKGIVNILNVKGFKEEDLQPGMFSPHAGLLSMKAVKKGIDLCMDGTCNALVTAPISKEAIREAGYNVPGHTEFLARNTGVRDYMMMLVNDNLRVGLTTIHIPLKDVPKTISTHGIVSHLKSLNYSLKEDFNISSPKIAVLGLNPHAGDGGVIGNEEVTIIKPALKEAKSQKILADGPYPADGFFGNRQFKHFDAVLAMYHDQGLIPFKTLSFGQGVNFTAGLPIIRTSPDHGTAFSIAGKNQADESSFQSAYQLAVTMSHNRQRGYKS